MRPALVVLPHCPRLLLFLVRLLGVIAAVGCARADHVRVSWENGVLTAGNDQIVRRWRLVGSSLQAESLQIDGQEWLARSAAAHSSAGPEHAAKVEWRVEDGRALPVEAPSKRGILTIQSSGGAPLCRWTVKVFADCPAVLCRWEPVREHALTATQPDITLEKWRFAASENEVTAVDFTDATDGHDNLVGERTWRLYPKEPLALKTNLCLVTEPGREEGVGILRLEALPTSRPVASNHDFVAAYQSLAMFAADAGDTNVSCEWAVFGYSADRWGKTQALQVLQTRLREFDPARDGRSLSNTWGDRNRDARITDQFVRREIAADAAMGIDICQIDDGWQQGTSANSINWAGKNSAWTGGFYRVDPQFWAANPQRFPQGLQSVATAAAQAKIGLGLWFSPDGERDYANWERDRDTILGFRRQWSVQHVKIDGTQVTSNLARVRLRRLIDEVLVATNGEMVFDFDITAGIRPGYFGLIECGPLFLENRYTDTHTWWPHATLRNLWQLSWYLPPQRLRIEFLNQARNQALYAGDPLAPQTYPADYGCAVSLVANPLAWCEVSELPPAQATAVARLLSVWKANRAELQAGTIFPIGSVPDGAAWTGFCSVGGDSCQVLVFRERTKDGTARFELPIEARTWQVETLAGTGSATYADGRLNVSIPEAQRYLWIKLSSHPLVVGIAGDSTVATYPRGTPQQGWGRYLQREFSTDVKVVNLAQGGRSAKTFLSEGWWGQLLAAKPAIVLIQFGHNDSHSPDHPEHTDPQGNYKELLRRYISDARRIGATPILVTPVQRRTAVDVLAPYAAAMREVAAEEKTKLIDLHRLSGELYARLGPAEVAKLERKGDRTHFNEAGAQAIEHLVSGALFELEPELEHLRRREP